jgi:hypothetical protein
MVIHQSRPNEGDFPSPIIIRSVILRVSVREFDGKTTVDVVDDKGNVYTGVEMIVPTCGDQTSYVKPPLKIGAEALLFKTSVNSTPYILGSTFTVAKHHISNTPIIPTKNQDDNAICTSDYVVENSGNKLSLNSYQRGIVLSANKDVRIQLANEGVFRISCVGETEDYVLNGYSFIEAIQQYTNELRQKEQKLEELQTQLISTISTLNGAIQEFAATQSAAIASAPVLAPLAPGYTTLSSATVTEVGNELNDCATINTELGDLALRDNDDFKVDAANSLNTKVILPKGG